MARLHADFVYESHVFLPLYLNKDNGLLVLACELQEAKHPAGFDNTVMGVCNGCIDITSTDTWPGDYITSKFVHLSAKRGT